MRSVRIPATLVVLAVAWSCGPSGGSAEGSRAEAAEAPPTQIADHPEPPPGHAWVVFGADTVVAEVARTAEEREQGLMYRQELPAGTGMLFVFDDAEPRSFWMQNTYVALDIAFLDVSLRVVNIQQMKPLTTDPHDSGAPAMFALEVPEGWFAAHGVEVGDTAKIEFGP